MSDNIIKLNLYEEFKDTKYSDIISIIVSKHHSYYKVPPTGCPTFEKTFENLNEIEEVLTQNIGLERDVMYEGLRKEKI